MNAVASPRLIFSTLLVSACLLYAAAIAQPKTDVIYVPTPQEVVDRMLEMTKVTKNDYVIDLGSGDGRIAIAAGKLGARAMGIDIDPERIREANANLEEAGVGNRVNFKQANLFETDFSDATVITMYLLDSLNLKLRPTILNMKPGTRVVSHDFSMGEWEPDETAIVNGSNVYMWIVPAQVSGNWQVRSGRGDFAVDLSQEFQKLSGTAQLKGGRAPITGASVNGDEITFSVDTGKGLQTFNGKLNGNGSIEGKGRGREKWSAVRT